MILPFTRTRPGDDELLGGAARRDARARDDLLQSFESMNAADLTQIRSFTVWTESENLCYSTRTMRRVDKPWGYELVWAETERYVGKILHMRAGERLSRQYHQVKEETLMVESGEMDLEVGPGADVKSMRMGPRDVFHVKPGPSIG